MQELASCPAEGVGLHRASPQERELISRQIPMHNPSLDIVFYTEGLPFHGHTMYEQALGGSETALTCVARELAALGHRVRVFCRCPRPGVYSYRGCFPVGASWAAAEGRPYTGGRSSAAPLRNPTPQTQGGSTGENEDLPQPTARVEYLDLADFPLFCETDGCDVFICSRFLSGLAAVHSAKFHALWCHDVLTRETAPLLNGLLWKIDRLFVLSQFQKEQYTRHLPHVPERCFYVTRNGVDIELVERAISGARRTGASKRFIYASRPERGLEILLDIWPHIAAKWPDAELLICRYDHPEGDRRMSSFLAALGAKMERLKGLRFLGGLSKEQLYREMAGCDLMLYPSIFPEVSCISAIEAAACGLPIVASKYCALKETVADGETGLLIAGDPRTQAYRDRYLAAVQKLMSDDELRAQMSQRAREFAAEKYRWRGIAREWEKLFLSHFRSVPKRTVLRHLVHNSDLVAARDAGLATAEELGIDWLDDPDRYRLHYEDAGARGAEDDPGFCAGGASLADPPGRAGQGGQAACSGEPTLRGNSRFHWLKAQLENRPEITALLDVGCWFGHFAVALTNEIPSLKVVGFDVSRSAVARAEETRENHALRPGNLAFCSDLSRAAPALLSDAAHRGGTASKSSEDSIAARSQGSWSGNISCPLMGEEKGGGGCGPGAPTAPHPASPAKGGGDPAEIGQSPPCRAAAHPSRAAEQPAPDPSSPNLFDAAFIGEVLEHVRRVEPFVAEVEEKVREGGWVFVTLPRGPWESMSFEKNRRKGIQPSHVRSWEYRDVLEVFGHRDSFELSWSPCGQTPLGEAVGHWLVAYRLKAGEEPGAFDHARKLVCSPRQTLSVCMILGGEEASATLHRCLRSVRPIADEIIIAASRCDEETLGIARQYADTIFEIPWLEGDGLPNFSAARNRSIEKATCDWVLWLDADEYLVGAGELPKYLRPNIYNAYVIRQWHHAIDAHFEPDLPMRCFRNGLGVKFFGAIHEHPETALNMGISPHVILTDVNIIHDGYVTEEKRVGRFRRNLPVLVKDRRLFPERRLGKLFWLRDLVQSARHEMMANGGPTRHAQDLLEEAIELYRAEFSSPSADFHNQARGLYEHALQLLSRGHPVAVLVASPDGRQQPEIRRVETVEELKGELWHAAVEALHETQPAREFPFEKP